MTDLERAILHIRTRADAWAVKEVEKALSQEPCEDWYDVPSDEMTLEQARRAVKDLRKKLSEHLEQEPKWIPVSERLPKESDGKVLITVNGKVRTGQYSEYSNRWYKGDMCGVGGDDPLAWMPLPKPYEPQESEERK